MRLTKQGWGLYIRKLGSFKSSIIIIIISIINKVLSITISKVDKGIGINIYWNNK